MSDARSSLKKAEMRVAVPASNSVVEPAEDLRRLGEALKARAGDVLSGTVARTRASKHVLSTTVEDSFERICTASTAAVAGWMAGESLEVAREVGMETWQIFGQLAAERVAPLDEVTKRCLGWRDAAAEVLDESATQLGVSAETLLLGLAASGEIRHEEDEEGDERRDRPVRHV